MKQYTIEEVQGAGPDGDRRKIIHQAEGENPYHAYEQFRERQGLKREWQTDDIGSSNNPCVRFIIGKPGPEQLLFYVKPRNN